MKMIQNTKLPVLMHIRLTGSTNVVKHLRVKQCIADQ